MSYDKVFDDDDIPSEVVEFAESRDRLYALIEKHPVIVLPIMNENVSEDENKHISDFLFALFSYNGVVVTYADGIAVDPYQYEDKAGPYKHSKGKVTEFLILTDVHDETGTGYNLMRLAQVAARECGLPFIASIKYRGFESSVNVLIPSEDKEGWVAVVEASLISLIIQSRSLSSPVPKLDLPFTLEYIYSTVTTEKKLYKLTGETPLVAYDIGNHPHSSWSDYPMR